MNENNLLSPNNTLFLTYCSHIHLHHATVNIKAASPLIQAVNTNNNFYSLYPFNRLHVCSTRQCQRATFHTAQNVRIIKQKIKRIYAAVSLPHNAMQSCLFVWICVSLRLVFMPLATVLFIFFIVFFFKQARAAHNTITRIVRSTRSCWYFSLCFSAIVAAAV